MAASDSPTTVQQLGCLLLDFAPQGAFYFDEKVTQSIAQVTMSYQVSKDSFPLYFAVGQVVSISGYDLENGTLR